MKKLFFGFCFFFLFSLSLAFFANAKEPQLKKFETVAGVFKLEIKFDIGGLRLETIITPKGKRIQGFPFCSPDEKCYALGLATETVIGFSSHEAGVYLLTDHSVWQWNPAAEKFEFIFAGQFSVSRMFKTSIGNVFSLLPEDGDLNFHGLIYFRNGDLKKVTLARGNNDEVLWAEKIIITEEGNLKIVTKNKKTIIYDPEAEKMILKKGEGWKDVKIEISTSELGPK